METNWGWHAGLCCLISLTLHESFIYSVWLSTYLGDVQHKIGQYTSKILAKTIFANLRFKYLSSKCSCFYSSLFDILKNTVPHTCRRFKEIFPPTAGRQAPMSLNLYSSCTTRTNVSSCVISSCYYKVQNHHHQISNVSQFQSTRLLQ